MTLGALLRVLLYFTVGAIRGHFAAVALGLDVGSFQNVPEWRGSLCFGLCIMCGERFFYLFAFVAFMKLARRSMYSQ